MATNKPRITVTLTPRQYEVLKTIADTGGATMSGMLGEFIESAMPTFERMAATFQQVHKANQKERERIVEALSDAQTALEPIALAAVGQFDLFLGKLEGAVEGRVRGGAADSALLSAAPVIPRTNRGVTPIRAKRPQPNTGKALKAVQKKEVSKKVSVSNGHKPKGCTCTVTDYERQENKTCPVHSRKGGRHAV